MNAEIISVVRAVELGDTSADCAKAVSERFAAAGITAGYHSTVSGAAELKRTLRTAVMRSDLIAIIGGVGAAADDITVSAVSSAVGMRTDINEGLLGELKARSVADAETLADIPVEAEYFLPEGCLIPGCGVKADDQYIVMLPAAIESIGALCDCVLRFAGIAGEAAAVSSADDSAEAVDSGAPVLVQPDFDAPKAAAPVFRTAVLESDLADFEGSDEPAAEPTAEPAPAPEPPKDDIVIKTPRVAPKADAFDAEQVAAAAAAGKAEDDEWEIDRLNEKQSEAVSASEAKGTDLAEVKKPAPAVAVAKYLFPWKGDSLVDVVRKVLFFVAIIGIIVSGVYVTNYFVTKFGNDSLIDTARGVYDPTDSTVNKDGILNRFSKLLEQNSDCVGWLTVPNTNINNPVYQTTDNDFYINHNMNKEKSVYGALFVDAGAKINKTYVSRNLTIYGHHMKDGTMLANVHKYKDINFYKDNPVIRFDTIYGQGGRYKVFACMITNAEAKDDNGYVFDYTASEFDSSADFLAWIEQVRRRSLYVTPVDVQADDEILTLSTCTYEIKNTELRCVLVARKVRSGENATVNTSEATANTKIIYPAVWYAKYGGKKPTYEDGLTTWIGQPDRSEITDVDTSRAPGDTSSIEPDSSEPTSSGATSSEATSSASTSSASTSSEATSSAAASSEATSSAASSETESSSEASSSGDTSSGAETSSGSGEPDAPSGGTEG